MQIAPQNWRTARSLIRAPGFTSMVVLTLSLGIGVSTAVFSIANGILLRELPVSDQERLVVLWGETRDGRFSNWPLALEDIRAFERRSRSIDRLAFFAFRGATATAIRSGDRVAQAQVAMVSGNFFEVLQSRALLGRTLVPNDDVAGAAPVIVFSHRAWMRHFGGDTAIAGKAISMVATGRSYTVVGVMPKGLEYPSGAEIWAPVIAYSAAGGFHDIAINELDILARLRRDASAEQARSELSNYFGRRDAPAWQRDVRGAVYSLRDIILGNTRAAVIFVSFAAALLLFISCINVANLLLVRSLGRVREFAVRAALGASRTRMVAQLFSETTFLAVAGGVVGFGLAFAVVKSFVAVAPESVPRLDQVDVNGTALLLAIAITAVALVMSALAPALVTSRAKADDALRSSSRNTATTRVRTVTQLLVVAQIALAAVSLITAGLITKSLVRLHNVEFAFEPRQLLVANLAMGNDQISGAERRQATLDLVVERAGGLPGVSGVTPVMIAPFVGAGGGIDGRLVRPGQSVDEAAGNPILNLEAVATNYFEMLRIPVLRGRSFADADVEGTRPVIVVSASVARHFWPNADPIGKTLRGGGKEYYVVGVVPDTRYRELRTARSTVYLALKQAPFGGMLPSTLLIRTTGAPETVISALRRAVSDVHPAAVVTSATPLQTLLDVPRAEPRLNAIVLGLFAAVAVALAAIGLFAVIATLVRQRTREIGIRMALGATAGNVRRVVMLRGVSLAAAGTALGIAGALGSGRLLAALLFQVSSTDVPTLVSVSGLILIIALIACYLPARSSSMVDPVIALRNET